MKYIAKDDGYKEFLSAILNKEIDLLYESYQNCFSEWMSYKNIEYLCDYITDCLKKNNIIFALTNLLNKVETDFNYPVLAEGFLSIFGFKAILKSLVYELRNQKTAVFLFEDLFTNVDFEDAALMLEPGITHLVSRSLGGYNIKAIWIPATVKVIDTSFTDLAKVKVSNIYFEAPEFDNKVFDDANFNVSKADFINKFNADILE